MKYTRQLFQMVNKLRKYGLTINYIDTGAITSNGYYFETSSQTNIYRHGQLIKQYKSPKSAISYLLKMGECKNMNTCIVHCYIDNLIDNTDGKFDAFGSA